MDAPDSYKWLKGGEFILTTGFIFGGDEWQFEHFIDNLINAGCSAAGIKKGRFLTTIPESVIQTAEQNQFPIIEIPYSYGWSDIISAFYDIRGTASGVSDSKLVESNQISAQKSTDNFTNINEGIYNDFLLKLHSKTVSENDCHLFDKQHPSDADIHYCILLFEGILKDAVSNGLSDILNNPRLSEHYKAKKYIIEIEAEQTVITVLALFMNNIAQLIEWQFSLYDELGSYYNDSSVKHISMGRLYPNANGIIKSYREAVSARDIGKAVLTDKHLYYYPLLSVYDILLSSDKTDTEFDCIHILEHYQEKQDYDVIECLEVFLENGWKKAALKLFLHENTLRYRIQKIEDLLSLDLNDNSISNSLLTQIKIWRLKYD